MRFDDVLETFCYWKRYYTRWLWSVWSLFSGLACKLLLLLCFLDNCLKFLSLLSVTGYQKCVQHITDCSHQSDQWFWQGSWVGWGWKGGQPGTLCTLWHIHANGLSYWQGARFRTSEGLYFNARFETFVTADTVFIISRMYIHLYGSRSILYWKICNHSITSCCAYNTLHLL